ncbi:hypothetical protein GCM10010336_34710 [Streptomyces goshikiensis]|nr:hypothetical protein GCM10010336_34710 [Streptomyces goshikiensis]
MEEAAGRVPGRVAAAPENGPGPAPWRGVGPASRTCAWDICTHPRPALNRPGPIMFRAIPRTGQVSQSSTV